jgi:hypothetical protein
MSRQDLTDKFRDCVSYSANPVSPENAAKVIDLIDHLEGVDDVGEVISLLV